jgi:hypothetical protein
MFEHIFKVYAQDMSNEMISESGDRKIINMNKIKLREFKERKDNIGSKDNIFSWHLNADATKWSAKDNLGKYGLLIAVNPNLHPIEKKNLIRFIFRYTEKRIIVPDKVLAEIANQPFIRENDPIRFMTKNLKRNYYQISLNWLMGNFNYTSSVVHGIEMNFCKKVTRELFDEDGISIDTYSLVHSDDNCTTYIARSKNEIDQYDCFIKSMNSFIACGNGYAIKVNIKKTSISTRGMEFISQVNIGGQQICMPSREIVPIVADLPGTSFQEDYFAILAKIQAAFRMGLKPSSCWAAIAVASHLVYNTYGMLEG